MALDYTKKTARRRVPFMDIFHVVICAAILVLFIIMVIDFDRNRRLLPYIILGVAVMDGGDVIYQIQHLPHGRKHLGGVFLGITLTIFFLLAGLFIWMVYYW